jgi:hypothetical protein
MARSAPSPQEGCGRQHPLFVVQPRPAVRETRMLARCASPTPCPTISTAPSPCGARPHSGSAPNACEGGICAARTPGCACASPFRPRRRCRSGSRSMRRGCDRGSSSVTRRRWRSTALRLLRGPTARRFMCRPIVPTARDTIIRDRWSRTRSVPFPVALHLMQQRISGHGRGQHTDAALRRRRHPRRRAARPVRRRARARRCTARIRRRARRPSRTSAGRRHPPRADAQPTSPVRRTSLGCR